MSGDRFAQNGSPLAGKRVPYDWARMELPAMRACLIANGWATDFRDASRVLALHAHAAREGRKAKAARIEMAQARWED
jgi:hypothetical protein